MPVYQLESFVVVAPNLWQPERTLDRGGIASAKPVDLAAILSSKLPSAAFTRKGPLAGDIVLRGFGRDNVAFTVDNNKTFCACPNRMDPPAFHVSSQQIESISVRTGPFSVDQGSSVGGQIAVRTSEPTGDTFGRFYGYAGSYDYFSTGVTGGVSFTDTLYGLGGVYYQRGGVYEDGSGTRFTEAPGLNYRPEFRNEDAFEVLNFEVKGSYVLKNAASLTVSYAYQDASDVLYPGLRMDAPEDTMNRASIAYRLSVDWVIADSVEASFAYSQVDHDMRDAFRTSLNNMGDAFVSRGYFMRTEAQSRYLGGRLDFGKDFSSDSLLRYGVDLQRREWDANNIIGMQRNNMLPDTVTDGGGAWVVYEQQRGEWMIETGLRFDVRNTKAHEDISFLRSAVGTDANEQTDLLPSAYALASRELSDALTAYAGLGFASRVPDPQERYMNLNRPMMNSDWVGNPDLDPVENLELQGGLRWQEEAFDAEISLFHAWLSDYIYLASINANPPTLPGGATTYENIDARIYGASVSGGWNASETLRFEAGLAYQHGEKKSRPRNGTNDVLGEIPPLRGRLAALFSYEKFSAQAVGLFQADLDRVDSDIGEQKIDGWAVLNLSASYQFNGTFSLSVGVDNVFDRNYATANSFVRDPFRSGVVVNEPGRFLFARVGFEF
ncbi:MAG: TonB-dependent receptor [Verrucomicrobia bacterium]|nr:TonB-dependent receptor [Verrucomicrobiota bacterium]